MTATVDELVETFDLLGEDWEERFRYVIGLGRQLPAMPEDAKTEDNRVQGCQSKAWLIARQKGNGTPTLEFLADADAFIVRGLIAILLLAYSNKTPREIVDFDIDELFAKLGLDRHLTPARSNGLHSMVNKIRGFARTVQEKGHLP